MIISLFDVCLKTKLISIIIALIALSTIISISTVMVRSIRVTNDIMDLLVEDKISSSNKMLATYLKEQFGNLSLDPNIGLVDENGLSIEGRFDYIDQFSDHMDLVVTIFAKDGSNFTRTLTNVRDD